MTTPTTTSRRPLRVGYLVSGLVSLGLAGVWALWAGGVVDGLSVSWLLPSVLLAAGLLGLVAMLAAGRRTPATPEATRPTAPEAQDLDDHTRPYPTKESR